MSATLQTKTNKNGKTVFYIVVDGYTYKDGIRKRRLRWQKIDPKDARTKDDAEAFVRSFNKNKDTLPEHITFATMLEEWLPTHNFGLSPATITQQNFLIQKHILPELGALKISTITPKQLERFLTQIKAGFSLRRQVYALLSQAFQWATDTAGYLNKNPMLKITRTKFTTRPKNDQPKRDYLTKAQAEAFFSANIDDDFWPLAKFLVLEGTRINEALALRWSDIDNAVVHITKQLFYGKDVPPKTRGSIRDQTMVDELLPILQGLKDRQAQDRELLGNAYMGTGDYVFCTHYGTPLNASNVRRAFARMAKKAGLPPITPHQLRRTYATNGGTDLVAIARSMGHTTLTMTLIYTGATQERQNSIPETVAANLRAEA